MISTFGTGVAKEGEKFWNDGFNRERAERGIGPTYELRMFLNVVTGDDFTFVSQ